MFNQFTRHNLFEVAEQGTTISGLLCRILVPFICQVPCFVYPNPPSSIIFLKVADVDEQFKRPRHCSIFNQFHRRSRVLQDPPPTSPDLGARDGQARCLCRWHRHVGVAAFAGGAVYAAGNHGGGGPGARDGRD